MRFRSVQQFFKFLAEEGEIDVSPMRTKASNFLVADPPPVRRSDLPAWEERVRTEMGAAALPADIELLEIGSPAEQYAAMAAARVLGAEVWATDPEPNLASQPATGSSKLVTKDRCARSADLPERASLTEAGRRRG